MHHFKAASLRLQSLNQCGDIETEASVNLKRVLWKETRLWLFRIFKKPQSKNNDLWDISRNFFWHQRKALWKHRIEILLSPRPRGFGDSLLFKLACQPVWAAIMCSCYSEVVGEFEGLSATVAAGWIRYFAALVKIWCQDNNGHQQRLPGWLLNTSWSGSSAQSLAACFRGSVLTHHRRR